MTGHATINGMYIKNPVSKRIFDLIFGTLALLLASPLMMLVALIIFLEQRQNPFFAQRRTGLGGSEFTIYKFRTMTESAKGKYYSITAPSQNLRITSFGKILRDTSIDELPQLFNVLIGNMSLVGPRPEPADFISRYGSKIKDYHKRLRMKPGITGLVQLTPLRYELDSVEKFIKWVRFDTFYIKHWSILLDVWVCWKTIRVVFDPDVVIRQEEYFRQLRKIVSSGNKSLSTDFPKKTTIGFIQDGRNRFVKSSLSKRVFDFVIGLFALLLASPLIAVIALIIILEQRRNPIFTQRRTGLGGREFTICKFRTMRESIRDGHVPSSVILSDPRITWFGRFLRNTSIDELPQLFNVLKGDMSLVGPRPQPLNHLSYYGKRVRNYHERLQMKPGITGLVQITPLRYLVNSLPTIIRQTHYDVYYVRHWSLWLDIWICWKTVLVLWSPSSIAEQKEYFAKLQKSMTRNERQFNYANEISGIDIELKESINPE